MKRYLSIFFFVLLIQVVLAVDNYKPYLHQAAVPKHPDVKLYGQYHTELFPGAATYSYPIATPKGVNGLSPSISVFYNSQQMNGRSSVLGAGWSMNKDYIYRDNNHTADNSADDKFILSMDGNIYELVFVNGVYKTEVDYYFRIQNYSDYWIVTTQDGTKHIFGNTSDSKINGKWFLNSLVDTHGNAVYYSYLQSPFSEDSNAVYLSTITYGSRRISFSYESSVRPDRRRTYENGNLVEESRRLNDISIFVDGLILQRHQFSYSTLNPATSSISKITYFGSDNTSTLYNITFDYYNSDYGYGKDLVKWYPPALFSDNSHNDYGARLVDLNNDGFMDTIQRIGSGANKAWLNNKLNNFTEDLGFASPVDLVTSTYVDEGVRFADVNNDGFTDLLKSKNGARSVYLNTGSGWNLSSITIPLDFVDTSGNDLGVVLEDVNGDGRVDLVQSKDGTRTVYLNNGNGWTLSSWSVPVDFMTASSDTGARLVDLNGDGLSDLIQSSNKGSVVQNAWLNNGSGWVNSSTWLPPSGLYFTTTANPDNGVRFADVNGDGLVDMLEDIASNGTSTHGAWLNTGNGWTVNNNWQSPEAFTSNGYNIGRRLADLNGDGFVDIIVSHQDSSNQYVWLKNSTLPYQMKSIKNEFGGITAINYTTSTKYDNTLNGLSQIGFNIYVVSKMTANNSLSGDFNALSWINYNYSFGKYNYDKAEFRGFGKTTELKPSTIVNHYFYQDSPRRGKEYRTEIMNSTNSLFSAQDNNWNWTQQNGVYNLSLLYTTDYVYDGASTPRVSNTSYFYNNFGNYGKIIKQGDSSDLTDDRIYEYKYAINTNPWILNKVASETVYDANYNKIKETKYYYDNLGLTGVSKGELTKTEAWNNNGDNLFTYYTYDQFGNPTSKTDPNGNTEKYIYDSNNIYLSSIINPLGHIARFNYDSATGNLLWTETNNIRTSYEYDKFARVSKEIKPYDSQSLPTKQYTYDFDGVAPESVKISLRTTANNYDDTIFYYDGFSNLVQIKSVLENTNNVKNIFYDNQFRVASEQNPYFDSTSGFVVPSTTANKTYYTYDSMDRVISVTNPDGTQKKVTFDRWNITDYDENGRRHKYELDGFGQIAKVIEYNDDPYTGSKNESYETFYDYDSLGNLIKITDAKGNEFRFTYDSLGRKTAMSDPDMGNWIYGYDANSNLIRQLDNRNNATTLFYDALNRILAKSSDDFNTTFTYDVDFKETLSKITYSAVNISYKYDNRLRVIKEIQNSDLTLEIDYMYDSQNRLISENENEKIDYLFNKLGKIKSITGYISDSNYNPFGSVLNKTYMNSLVNFYSYNQNNNKLVGVLIPNIQNLSYTYDNVGNIVTINDAVNNRLSQMTYDNLDRLVTANIGSDSYYYSYNQLGNIMKAGKNGESKKFVYNNLAHAPSSIINGSAGVDVYAVKELDTQSKNRTYEFFLLNDAASNISGVNFTVDFGNGQSFTESNLSISDDVMVFVQQNYSAGGDYKVNISAQSLGISDKENLNTKFGLRANSLSILSSNISGFIFELVTRNDIIEPVRTVMWNCSEGISSLYGGDLLGLQYQFDYLANNYSSFGQKRFSCDVTSQDGNDQKSIDFNVKGLEIEGYDTLMQDISRRVVTFNAVNYFNPVAVNITVTGESTSNYQTNINSNEKIMSFVEVNYSSDGNKELNVKLSTNETSTNYKDLFTLTGAAIENYYRTNRNYTTQIMMFDVVNKWHNGSVNWSISSLSISDKTNLNNNEILMVFIEENYTAFGNEEVNITAKASTYTASLSDLFELRPLQITSFLALLGNRTSSVFEVFASNNIGQSQNVSILVNTGEKGINSNIENVSEDVFVFIETNYSNSSVYTTTAYINSSQYNDNETGVIII